MQDSSLITNARDSIDLKICDYALPGPALSECFFCTLSPTFAPLLHEPLMPPSSISGFGRSVPPDGLDEIDVIKVSVLLLIWRMSKKSLGGRSK